MVWSVAHDVLHLNIYVYPALICPWRCTQGSLKKSNGNNSN